jgi:cytochrome c-type biogenesis protein CcmH/NrfF
MEPDEVLKLAALVKVSMLAGIRKAIKQGKTTEQVLDRYEYSTFIMKDGELLLVPPKKR